MKIVALAGGVGGAKLAHGFSKIINTDDFSVIVNTGDDFTHFGLTICPDIDTVCYTLSEKSNPVTGWGRNNESFDVMDALKELNAPDWFLLGDKDLALHLERTRLLWEGQSLTLVTERLRRVLGVHHSILPMTNELVRTFVNTVEHGKIPFQEYFVKYKYLPKTIGFDFIGIEKAFPSPEVLGKLAESDLVILCPSNPFVSINPIISLPGVRNILRGKFIVGVSPIIGGKAVKGPLALMLQDANLPVEPESIIKMYDDFLDIFLIDTNDHHHTRTSEIPSSIIISDAEILLTDISKRIHLAETIINLYEKYK